MLGFQVQLRYRAESDKAVGIGTLVLPARTHCIRSETNSGCVYVCPDGYHLNLRFVSPYPHRTDQCSSLVGPTWALNSNHPSLRQYDCATCQQSFDTLPTIVSPTSCSGNECATPLECPAGFVLSEPREVCAMAEDPWYPSGTPLPYFWFKVPL